MSLLLNQKHLRVETPQTTDGQNLLYDEAGRPVIKISLLPLSARRNFEAINAKLPKHLQSKIMEINPEPVADAPKKLKQNEKV